MAAHPDNVDYELPAYHPGTAMVVPPAPDVGSNDFISYAGPPTINPPLIPNIVVDTNGQAWAYYGGAWNALSGSGVAQVFKGAFDDPNGHVTPTNQNLGAIYYKDQPSPVIVWSWSVASKNWFPLIT
jgi:hypothetical protein